MTERQPQRSLMSLFRSHEVKSRQKLLEYGRVLSTACMSNEPLLASNEKFGQGDTKVTATEILFLSDHMNGVLE